jgi:hypothetical protein
MRDEMTDAWAAFDELMRRCLILEEIAERMTPTCADPVAVADFWEWKAGSRT